MTLEFRITGGTGAINGDYVQYDAYTGTLTANATNYIWVEDPDGDGYGEVKVGTSGFPADVIQLWEIDTDSSGVVDKRDVRTNLIQIRGSASGDINFLDTLQVKDARLLFDLSLPFRDQFDIDDPLQFDLDGNELQAQFSDQLSIDDSGLDFTIS